MNIKGRDVEIADDGPVSPGFYGNDDPVHIDGQKANPLEAFQVMQTISSLVSKPSIGLHFQNLRSYLHYLEQVHISQYPLSPLLKMSDESILLKFKFKESINRLSLPFNLDDASFTTPEIAYLRIVAKNNVDKAVKILKSWPKEKRLALLDKLTNDFAFRPTRTYQKDEGKRFKEMVVGYFIRHIMKSSNSTTPFPIQNWIKGQTGGRMKREENKEGLKYIKRLTKDASQMGTTLKSQKAFFSDPYRLALLLHSVIAPKPIYHKNEYRYYRETPDYAHIVAERTFSFGTVVFYSIDHIYPTQEVIDTVAAELEMTVYEVDYNPVLNVIFTPNMHGARISMAEQNYKGDGLPALLGFIGDYITIGLDAYRIPTCTVNHEVGHQKYWQLAESEIGTVGPEEQAFIDKLHTLYEEAMKTDGGEIINDSTYTGLLRSGHPYKFIEFFSALRHAYVEHGNEFLKRIQATPKNHYARKLWQLMKELYGVEFTSESHKK